MVVLVCAAAIAAAAPAPRFFFHSVAVAADVHHGAFVEKAVERGTCHDGVRRKDLCPVGEGFVRGEDDGAAAFVALADGLEEQTGFDGLQCQVADFRR